MRIETEFRHDVTILDLIGRFVHSDDASALSTALDAFFVTEGKKLVLNLGRLQYISSTGLGVLVQTYTRARRQGVQLWLTYPTKSVKDVLSITKLLSLFQFVEVDDIVGVLADSRLELLCPSCDQPSWIGLRPGTDFQACLTCGVQLQLVEWPTAIAEQPLTAECAVIRMPTYEDKFVTLRISDVHMIEIEDRLDRFASEVIEDLWQMLAPPRRVMFIVEHSRCSDAGLQALLNLCALSNDDNRAVIVVKGVTTEARERLPKRLEIHEEAGPAREALKGFGEQLPRIKLKVRRA